MGVGNKIQPEFLVRSVHQLETEQNLPMVGAQRGVRGPADAPAQRACPGGSCSWTLAGAEAHPSLDLASHFPSPLQSTVSTSWPDLPLGTGVPAFGAGNGYSGPASCCRETCVWGLGSAPVSALKGEARTHWVRSSWEEEKTQIIFVFSSEQNIHGLCRLQGARRGPLCLLGVCDHTLRTEAGRNGLPSVPQPIPGFLTLSGPPQWSVITHLEPPGRRPAAFPRSSKNPTYLGLGRQVVLVNAAGSTLPKSYRWGAGN